MTRVLFISLFALICQAGEAIAQNKGSKDCSISLISDETERTVENHLTNRCHLIKLRLFMDSTYNQDSIYLAWEQSNLMAIEGQTINHFVDSIVIRLSNGLSWNINEGPPQKPANFVFKLFTKKAKTDQATIDYRKYLEFCSRWADVKKPCEIIDEYSAYTRINIDGTDTFRATYDIAFQPTTKKICREVFLIDKK